MRVSPCGPEELLVLWLVAVAPLDIVYLFLSGILCASEGVLDDERDFGRNMMGVSVSLKMVH
jgi:hypothetical protein